MPQLTYIITLRHGLKKFQRDAGLIPPLTVLTVCPSSSLLSSQPHSTICKSSRPQWNRVATEEEHKVIMTNMSSTSFTSQANLILTLSMLLIIWALLFNWFNALWPHAFTCLFCFTFLWSYDIVLDFSFAIWSGSTLNVKANTFK